MTDSDRDLLEAAAHAAGVIVFPWPEEDPVRLNLMGGNEWNPLTDDGDAFRLAVKLGMHLSVAAKATAAIVWPRPGQTVEHHDDDPYAATRRAIVRAAAAQSSSMEGVAR